MTHLNVDDAYESWRMKQREDTQEGRSTLQRDIAIYLNIYIGI